MEFLTLHEFVSKYITPRPHVAFRSCKEGIALTDMAVNENLPVKRVIGTRCGNNTHTSLEYVNAYPIGLLIRFFGNQLNKDGLLVKKSGCPQATKQGGHNAD